MWWSPWVCKVQVHWVLKLGHNGVGSIYCGLELCHLLSGYNSYGVDQSLLLSHKRPKVETEDFVLQHMTQHEYLAGCERGDCSRLQMIWKCLQPAV